MWRNTVACQWTHNSVHVYVKVNNVSDNCIGSREAQYELVQCRIEHNKFPFLAAVRILLQYIAAEQKQNA